MHAYRLLRDRLRALLGRDAIAEEIHEEIQFHLSERTREYERRGLPPSAARRAALNRFGNPAVIQDRAYDVRRSGWRGSFAQDLKFGARLLVKDRWFTLAAVASLALGIAISNTVFTAANALVLRGLPVEDSDRILYLSTRDARDPNGAVSYRDYVDWQSATRAFAVIAAFADTMLTIADDGRAPDRIFGSYLSANAFRVLPQKPLIGRDFLPEDDRPGAPATVILGHSLWTSRYGGDSGIVGRTIRVNSVPTTVIGVMPAGFKFPFNAEAWQPLSLMPGLAEEKRDARTLGAFGRLADGASAAQAQMDLQTTAARLARDHPETNRDVQAVVMTFSQRYNGSITDPIFLALLGAVAFVLLIACANVANLLLARSARRGREISLRLSLGATRSRIVQQLLIESVLLAVVAGVIGFGLSLLGVRILAVTSEELVKPYWLQFTMDRRVFAIFAAVCLGIGFVFGLAPALHASKTDVKQCLLSGAQTGVDRRSQRWGTALLVAEFALTVVLLTGAGLMTRSVLALHRADRVIDTTHVVAMRLALPLRRYPTPEHRASFYDQLEERLAAIRGGSSATIASTIPFTPAGPPRHLQIDGRLADGGSPVTAAVLTVGSRYFETLGLQMLRGRTFAAGDGAPGQEAAIVNQRFATMHFPGEDPLGRRIAVVDPNARGATPRQSTIVGVSPSVRQNMGAEPNPVVYLPYRASPAPFVWIVVRSEHERAAIATMLREQMRVIDPDLPLFGMMNLDQVLAQTLWPRRAFSLMFVVFGGIALALASLGLYAVTAYAVSQRTREIGVRMALGAPARRVWWLVLRRTLFQVGLGLAAGACGAFVVGRLLRTWLVQTSPTDWTTFLAVAAILVAVSLAAAFGPARCATRIDPLAALRCE